MNSDREAIAEGAQTRLAFGPGEQQEEPQLQLAPLAEHRDFQKSGVVCWHGTHGMSLISYFLDSGFLFTTKPAD